MVHSNFLSLGHIRPFITGSSQPFRHCSSRILMVADYSVNSKYITLFPFLLILFPQLYTPISLHCPSTFNHEKRAKSVCYQVSHGLQNTLFSLLKGIKTHTVSRGFYIRTTSKLSFHVLSLANLKL